MNWRTHREEARRAIHEAMGYEAIVNFGGGRILRTTVKLHRKQEFIGVSEDGYASVMSDVDRISFLQDSIPDNLKLDEGLTVVIRIGNDSFENYKIKLVHPVDPPNLVCNVVKI